MTCTSDLRSGVARAAFALALIGGASTLAHQAWAQSGGALTTDIGREVPEGTPLLLEADRLIYNRDDDTVTAQGAVRIAYGDYRLVAREVAYDQRDGRLIARGAVELIEPDGNRIYANEVDVTDDLAEGFVNALRVEAANNTRFAAESAVRGDAGSTTVFNNGVYTACEVCEDDPDAPLTWRIRARTVIWRQEERTVRFERPSFEFLGVPLFDLPSFTIPDPTVERKSGFLIPRLRYADELGVGLTVPYYFALNPSYDLTVQGTAYSRQGLLGEAQFRRRFATGDLELRTAGIFQFSPDEFEDDTSDDTEGRAMLGGRGDFRINERWQWGFDFLLQTDDNFSRTYDIDGYGASTFVNNIYLIGLDDRSYFEVKAESFDTQSDDRDFGEDSPVIYPLLDYERTFDRTLLGGDVSLTVNAVNLSRDEQDCRTSIPSASADTGFIETSDCSADPTAFDADRLGNREIGIEGDYARLTGEVAWQRDFTTTQGIVLTPMWALRADGVGFDVENDRAAGQPELGDESQLRTMTTAGLEARYPLVSSRPGVVQVVEPIGQLFVRPDEDVDGAIINEDAQSLVFSADTLFERDKFSGYDRVEGGTRANLGLRYSADFASGIGIDAVVGQSFHLGGTNPFAEESQIADLVNVGAQSGLETDRSDYVASLALDLPVGLTLGTNARLDEDTFEVRRAGVDAIYSGIDFTASASYNFVDEQPDVQLLTPRHEVKGAARVALGERWAIAANASYDIETQELFQRGAVLSYADECFAYALGYSENRRNLDAIDRSFSFNVSFRTLGDFGTSSDSFQ